MKKLLIIDGNSILNRAYYGIRPLTAPDGTPTNAVYGFLNILFKYLEEEKPDYLTVAFDVKEKTFRHKRYELYKAQRKPAPEDFIVQIPLMKEVLKAMNCHCMELPGFEADDIIGTVSRICDENGVACRILTGDKDDLQLASDNTVIKLVVTRGGKTETTDYDRTEFENVYGITPKSFIDVKALMGDQSDNIPGVKGIGEKTALSLIKDYESIDKIYANIDTIDVSDGVRKKLSEDKENAYLSYELATIDKNVPIKFEISDSEIKDYNRGALADIFTRLNFGSFIKKLELENDVKNSTVTDNIVGKGEETDFDSLIAICEKAEFTSYFIKNEILYTKPSNSKIGYYTNIDNDKLRLFLANEKIRKIGFDIKNDMISAYDFGIDAPQIVVNSIEFDVMLAAYILDPSQSEYSLDGLCMKYLSAVLGDKENKDESSLQISMLDLMNGENRDAELNRVFATERLFEKMKAELMINGQEKLYYEVELPLTEVLAKMQLCGMYVDKSALNDFGIELGEQILKLQNAIYDVAGEEFNINSPKQLGVILFEKLGLPYGKKNKSGGYSTNVDVLEKLRGEHKIADMILEYRRLAKLQSTYVVGLSAVVNEKTGRIHSSFNQMVTSTGRISSTEPNLQNIPIRTELGREIRRMFVSERADWCLIDADYSQIELRVLSHIANDSVMKEAFLNGDDIHTKTAARVFKTAPENVTSTMRFRAKAVNFGIVYGIGAFSLAQDIETTRKEAQNYIDEYLANFSGVDEYMKNVVEEAKKNGYVTTVLNRRRYLPELNASSHLVRAFGERIARNAPIQGSAADIIKIAMVNVYNRLKSEGMQARLILQVHDELIVEAPDAERERAEKILKEEMENAYSLSVPLSVEMNSGKSWYDTK